MRQIYEVLNLPERKPILNQEQEPWQDEAILAETTIINLMEAIFGVCNRLQTILVCYLLLTTRWAILDIRGGHATTEDLLRLNSFSPLLQALHEAAHCPDEFQHPLLQDFIELIVDIRNFSRAREIRQTRRVRYTIQDGRVVYDRTSKLDTRFPDNFDPILFAASRQAFNVA